jgi:hypothetical protein
VSSVQQSKLQQSVLSGQQKPSQHCGVSAGQHLKEEVGLSGQQVCPILQQLPPPDPQQVWLSPQQ